MKKVLALLMIFCMVAAVFVGCAPAPTAEESPSQAPATTAPAAEETAAAGDSNAQVAEEQTVEIEMEPTGTNLFVDGYVPTVCLLMAKSTSPYSGVYFKMFTELSPNYPDTKWVPFDAQSDATLQAQQADEAIAMGADLIMVQPVDNLAFVSSAEKISKEGIHLVVCNTALHESGEEFTTAFFGPDCYVEGQLAADMCHDAGMDGKSYVHLGQNDSNSTGRLRRLGFEDRNEEMGYGFVKLEESPDCDFSVEKAKGHMATFLTKYSGQIDFVYAIDDGGAYGAFQAVQEDVTGQNDHIKIASAAGGQEPNLNALKNTDMMIGLIYQGPKVEITGAMEFAHQILKGNMPVNKDNCMSLPIVTKANVDNYEVAY
ncbi:MAG: sugar ABC transporter substrate-binding protein [Christensenellales bacterium]|jgi:D-xylose transport system substrate-binding protein